MGALSGTFGASQNAEKENTENHRISDEDRMRDLVNQMLLSSAVSHLEYEAGDVEGWTFEKDGEILPPSAWDQAQTEAFYRWCKERDVPVPEMNAGVREAVERAHGRAVRSFAEAGGQE